MRRKRLVSLGVHTGTVSHRQRHYGICSNLRQAYFLFSSNTVGWSSRSDLLRISLPTAFSPSLQRCYDTWSWHRKDFQGVRLHTAELGGACFLCVPRARPITDGLCIPASTGSQAPSVNP